MVLSEINCKEIFKAAYEKRYTWPFKFNGYKGKCKFIQGGKSYEGRFTLSKNFKPEISGISQEKIINGLKSQLFEVAIHRVKKEFDEVHLNNQFQLVKESEKGLEMKVSGKNEGDRYRVKDSKINMVFRKIHGVIIEIFVEEFFKADSNFLSKRYTSQQLDIDSLSPKSNKYEYKDTFFKSEELGIWLLNSRLVTYEDASSNIISQEYIFEDLSKI